MLPHDALIHRALAEDLGARGDVTSALVIPESARAEAVMRARTPGVVAGMAVAARAFALCGAVGEVLALDGAAVDAGAILMRVTGPARAVLAAERVALNLACRLSGIATATAGMVAEAAGTKARIAATRKTAPGLRALEKAAVEAGGGAPHRYGLYDAILIKDNHIAIAGGVAPALAAARGGAGHMLTVAVEVDTLGQLAEVLAAPAPPDSVLLDNMALDEAREAVAMVAGRFVVEYSGSVRPGRVAPIAATGMDVISSGWLTHSAPALDLGLDVNT
jgi:nicotinate-nucleotide pyrophosphorylase (carboxylating)